MIISRCEMKKRNLPKSTIDGWTINIICKIWNLKDSERYYNEQLAKNIKTIEQKVDDLIEDKIIDDQVNRFVSKKPTFDYQNDWLLSQSHKDPEDLI